MTFNLDHVPTADEVMAEVNAAHTETDEAFVITMKYSEKIYTSYIPSDAASVTVLKIVRGNRKPMYRLRIAGEYGKRPNKVDTELHLTEEEYKSIVKLCDRDPVLTERIDVNMTGDTAFRILHINPKSKDSSVVAVFDGFKTKREVDRFKWPFKTILPVDDGEVTSCAK